MYQKSLVIISSVIVIGLFLIVLLMDKSSQDVLSPNEQEYSAEVTPVQPESQSGDGYIEPVESELIDPMPQAKIDIRVACESSLMYTTFTDGKAAEAYVEECVEGKHPEVIERYISEMGVDGAVI